jgi:hypothetical protein
MITYSGESDALYIQLRDTPVGRTVIVDEVKALTFVIA